MGMMRRFRWMIRRRRMRKKKAETGEAWAEEAEEIRRRRNRGLFCSSLVNRMMLKGKYLSEKSSMREIISAFMKLCSVLYSLSRLYQRLIRPRRLLFNTDSEKETERESDVTTLTTHKHFPALVSSCFFLYPDSGSHSDSA